QQPVAVAVLRAAFVAELRRVWRKPQFWIVVARQIVPVVGVGFFDWAALQIGLYFVIQSWLMLSLYCATDLTFDPKHRKEKTARASTASASTLVKNFFGAAVLMGFVVGIFGGILLFSFFRGEAWDVFVDSGWRE